MADARKHRHRRRIAACLLCLLLPIAKARAASPGGAEADPFALSPEELLSATVTSVSKSPERVFDAPAAVTVLTADDIRRSGATSIPEALRMVPGVQVARFNSSGWAVSVRGFNSELANKLLVLIDGREVYNHLYSGVYWDSQDTVLEDIARIEVIRGPGATLWGSNAVNGVINIITKPASETQGNLVSGLVGSEERIGTVRHGGTSEGGIAYRVYAKYLNRDPQDPLAGNRALDDWQAGRAGFRTDGGTERDGFTVQGDAYHSAAGQAVALPVLSPPYSRLSFDTVDATGANLLGRWTRTEENDARFTLQAYVDYARRDLGFLVDEALAFDLDGQYEFADMGRNKLVVGGKLRVLANDLTGSNFVTFPERQDTTEFLASAFVQDKITLVENEWYLTLGSKFEQNERSGFEIQPNARLQWHPDEAQMVWASVSRAVRTPSRLEQDLDVNLLVLPPSAASPVPLDVNLVANPDFDSESLIAYELGYRRQLGPQATLDITGFFNDYDDLGTNMIGAGTPVINGIDPLHVYQPLVIDNRTRGTAYGAEATIDWRPDDDLLFSASYSLLKIDLQGPPATLAVTPEAAEGETPRGQLILRSQWNVTDDIEFDAMLGHTGRLRRMNVDDYWRLDLRAGWRVSPGVELEVVGQNLLESGHREFASGTAANTNEIPRAVYGKLTWRF